MPCPPDAVIDLTMISTAEVTKVNHFTISCINGERNPAQVELDIKRDNKILIFPKEPNFRVHKPRNKEAVARDFRELDHIGIFYCESTQEVPPLETVTMINNFRRGGLRLHTTYTTRLLGVFTSCYFQATMTQFTNVLQFSYAFSLDGVSCLKNNSVYLCSLQHNLSQLTLH